MKNAGHQEKSNCFDPTVKRGLELLKDLPKTLTKEQMGCFGKDPPRRPDCQWCTLEDLKKPFFMHYCMRKEVMYGLQPHCWDKDLGFHWDTFPLNAKGEPEGPLKPWMTLKNDKFLVEIWQAEILEFLEDPETDMYSKWAIEELVNLQKFHGNRGLMEANRCLFHLMKDTAGRPRDHQGKYLKNNAEEALRAIESPSEWQFTRKGGKGDGRSSWPSWGKGKGWVSDNSWSASSTKDSSGSVPGGSPDWGSYVPRSKPDDDDPPVWKGGDGNKGLR